MAYVNASAGAIAIGGRNTAAVVLDAHTNKRILAADRDSTIPPRPQYLIPYSTTFKSACMHESASTRTCASIERLCRSVRRSTRDRHVKIEHREVEHPVDEPGEP